MLDHSHPTAGHEVVASMNPGYAAFSGAFGGWIYAHAYTAAKTHCAQDYQPISVTTEFIRGVRSASGGPTTTVRSSAHLLSSSGSAQFVRVGTYADDVLSAHTTAVFAKRRQAAAVAREAMPTVASPKSFKSFPLSNEQVTWTDRFEIRFAEGLPLKPNPKIRSRIWVRFRDAKRPFDVQYFLAMSQDDIEAILNVNVRAAVLAAQTAIPHFKMRDASSPSARQWLSASRFQT